MQSLTAAARGQALVRERMEDWGKGLCRALGKKIVELTGDFTPDVRCVEGDISVVRFSCAGLPRVSGVQHTGCWVSNQHVPFSML